jgi:hypothetical protein
MTDNEQLRAWLDKENCDMDAVRRAVELLVEKHNHRYLLNKKLGNQQVAEKLGEI